MKIDRKVVANIVLVAMLLANVFGAGNIVAASSYEDNLAVSRGVLKNAETTTGSAVTTSPEAVIPTSVATGAAINVSKKKIIINQNSTGKISFSIKDADKKDITKDFTVTGKTSNSKVVANPSIDENGKKIVFSVPKKATRGSKATVTLKARDKYCNFVKKTVKITVYVKNSAKSVKPAKTSYTIKRKKTKQFKCTVALQNKNKNTTDTMTVKSSKPKYVKVTKKSISKNKATIKVKGLKKGKAVITVKVGSKKGKVTIYVK